MGMHPSMPDIDIKREDWSPEVYKGWYCILGVENRGSCTLSQREQG